MNITDKALLKAICDDKDENAFRVFYDRYVLLLHNWALKRTGDKELSDDIVQNFWIIFWSRPTVIKVDENGKARSYLMRYFSFRMLDYLNSASAELLGDERMLKNLEESANYSHIFEELSVTEILSAIDEIVITLPQVVQDIFQFIWEDNHSVKEAALHFGVSEKVIRNRYKKVLNAVQVKIHSLNKDQHTLAKINTLVACLLSSDYLIK